ncbi:unnamed protein product, partial [Heterotrigona itama]
YQNNLKDKKLWLRITNLMKALDYAPPNLTQTDKLVEDYNAEGQFEN